ncbi:unnamed protein product [Rhizoctonia solani]|uniref:GATA-type domain-containing protein n=1 Tax=Rhizoctonia solani TaxID=456999 RepID=A0A8H3HKM0_9AGAM|nr:unnamed protein product [Rhizoctonia solani]
MSRPSSSRQTDTRSPLNATPSRRPSPATLAAANAEQAATTVTREASFKDGVLTILSYDTENVFILSNLSYEHVLESALANFGALKSSRVEPASIRLALSTWSWLSSKVTSTTSPVPTGIPPTRLRAYELVYELAPTSLNMATPSPNCIYDFASQGGTKEPSRVQYPYAQAHYIPSGPNAVSPTTDVSFLGVRPVVETDSRRDRPDSYHTEPPSKRRWDQVDDADVDERVYPMGPTAIPPTGSGNRQQFAPPVQQHEDARKPKRTRAWNPPDHQYMCRRCHRTDSPAWRKGPDGPKTLCNACGLSYAKDAARREAAASTPASSASAQAPSAQVSERPAPYAYNSDSTNSNHSRSGHGTGVKTLDGSSATLPTVEGTFQGPATAPEAPLSSMQPLRKCTMCKRTDSPQWRKVRRILIRVSPSITPAVCETIMGAERRLGLS